MDASSGEASWTLKVNLNALLGIDILDDISLTIGGGKYAYNGNYFKAINRIHAEAGVSLSGKTQDAEGNFTVEGDRLSLLQAVIDLRLTNLDNGIYENAWPSLAASAYAANFLSFASNGDFTEMGTMALPTSDKGGAAWNHEAYREDETHVGVNGKRNYYLFP